MNRRGGMGHRRTGSILPPRRAFPPLAFPTAMDDSMMLEAIGLARAAAGIGEVPVGAIVFETATGRRLAAEANCREVDGDPAGHAELLAIRAAAKIRGDWRLDGCTLVVTLEPCVMCAGAIVNSRVSRVVFGAIDRKAGAVQSLYRLLSDPRLNHRPVVIGGVRGEECGAELRGFFRRLRNARP